MSPQASKSPPILCLHPPGPRGIFMGGYPHPSTSLRKNVDAPKIAFLGAVEYGTCMVGCAMVDFMEDLSIAISIDVLTHDFCSMIFLF